MPIKFVKPQQKFKKNLAKEFQTFNEKPQQLSEHSPKYDTDALKKSSFSYYKPPKSLNNQQLTTQAKSPVIKSVSGSKSQLAPYHKPQSVSGQVSNNKSLKSSKKSLHQSLSKLRPLTPAEQLARSRQSSPQAQRAYSKMSSYDKRAFSKMSNYKKPQLSNANDHEATYGAKSSSKAAFSKVEKEKKAQSQKKKAFTQNESNEKAKIKKSAKNNQSDNFQISFPQMITQSQSAYPSSSYPNTGKESNSQGQEDWQRKRNSNITEEQQNQIEEPNQDDYISEGQFARFQGEQMADASQPSQLMGESGVPSQQNLYPSLGYNQLPQSYLMAMQILQAKILQQQTTIKKLNQKATKQNKRYKDLQIQVQSLHNVISDQQQLISQKDSQIRFLKGYLDQEKHNNRQALKQVAKNVYERSISTKKNTLTNYENSQTKSMKKTKKQLFTEEEKQNTRQTDSKSKRNTTNGANDQINFQNQTVEQIAFEDEKTQNQHQVEKPQQIEKSVKPRRKKEKTEEFESKGSSNKPSRPQIKHEKVQKKLTQPKQKYLQNRKASQTQDEIAKVQQKLAQQELIKDQLMREQILREQAIKSQAEKKYNYLEKSRRNDRSVSVKEAYPYTVKKLQTGGWDSSARKKPQDGERQLYSEGKRVRSMSTAVKYLEQQKNPNITYRPRNPQTLNVNPSFPYQGPPTSKLNPSVQSIMDPVLERYIQAKSDISSYRFNNDTAFFNEGMDLKSDKKNRQAVSQMRELMRGEKELVALNYRLEAIERRILECVKSTGKDDQFVKTIQQQAEEKILLEDLQKQYAILKKEFERKEVSVKQLKISLEQK